MLSKSIGTKSDGDLNSRPALKSRSFDSKTNAHSCERVSTPGRRRKYDFSSVDWKQRNLEIAQELGCDESLVCLYRKSLTDIPNPIVRKLVDWDLVDWTKTNKEIAQQLNCDRSTIGKKRKELWIPLPNTSFDWSIIDWTKTNKEISDQTGFRSTTISIKRSQLGKPKDPSKIIHDWSVVDWKNQTNDEIAALLGTTYRYVVKKRALIGIRAPNKKYISKCDWGSVDWNQSNKSISLMFNCCIEYVAMKRTALTDIKNPDRKQKAHWPTLDWSKSDSEIAKKYNYGKYYVSLKRKEFSKAS